MKTLYQMISYDNGHVIAYNVRVVNDDGDVLEERIAFSSTHFNGEELTYGDWVEQGVKS